jgi:DNA-binding transcriptional LysR family regulator
MLTHHRITPINEVIRMNINHLAIFRAVAEEGGVGKGAERLMISQPAVSKQLKQFERAMGVALFDRLPGGMRITAAGELLLGYARRLFSVEAEAEHALAQLKGLGRGRVAIGASMTIGVYLLPERVAAFRREHPQVELHWEIGNTEHIQQLLLDNTLDLAFTEGFVEAPELEARVFRNDELVPIARPDHPLLKQKSVALDAFLREPLILREAGSGTRAVVERALAEKGLEAHPILSLANTEAIKRAVAAGVGVAIVSRLAIEAELAAGQLALVPVRNLSIQRPLHILQLRGKHPSPAAQSCLRLFEAPPARKGRKAS